MKNLLDLNDMATLKRAVSGLLRAERKYDVYWEAYWHGSAPESTVKERLSYFGEMSDQRRTELVALLAEFQYTPRGRPNDAPPAKRSLHLVDDLEDLQRAVSALLDYAERSLEWCMKVANGRGSTQSADRRWGEYARLRDEQCRTVRKLLEEFEFEDFDPT